MLETITPVASRTSNEPLHEHQYLPDTTSPPMRQERFNPIASALTTSRDHSASFPGIHQPLCEYYCSILSPLAG